MNCLPQDAQAQTTRLSFPSWLGCFFHHAFLHFMEQKRWVFRASFGSVFLHCSHRLTSLCFCRCTNTFSAETSMPSSADISLYCLPAARIARIVLFSFSVIEKTSSRLVAARGGKKGRFRSFDSDHRGICFLRQSKTKPSDFFIMILLYSIRRAYPDLRLISTVVL